MPDATKVEDVKKYLSVERQKQLADLLRDIAKGRILEGKKPIDEYWVVNKDEPYSEQVKQLIDEAEKK